MKSLYFETLLDPFLGTLGHTDRQKHKHTHTHTSFFTPLATVEAKKAKGQELSNMMSLSGNWNITRSNPEEHYPRYMYQYTTTTLFIYTNGGQMHFCCNEEEI